MCVSLFLTGRGAFLSKEKVDWYSGHPISQARFLRYGCQRWTGQSEQTDKHMLAFCADD